MLIKYISDKITRIFEKNESMLSRYGILQDGNEKAIPFESNSIVLAAGKRSVEINFEKKAEGFEIRIPLSKKERIFGGGDSTREHIMHRGSSLTMHVVNFSGYGPIPVMFSTDGWGILVNCTYKHIFDIGETDSSCMKISAEKGVLDFYIFCGANIPELLKLYTQISGKPMILPKFAYGLNFVENEECDARSLLWDSKTFRERDIPCDMMGLEPNWMSKRYDYSTEKKWNKEKFNLPGWLPENQSGERTFFYPLREMGMNLSLWLCSNYDLFYKEEQCCLKMDEKYRQSSSIVAPIIDEHYVEGRKRLDEVTKTEEPWFEHLKKFVDNGAAAFKMDGADQVLAFPDRLWGGKYFDDEVHNVYPVVLAKQMNNGFREYTERRPFIYSAAAYAGIQQYAATWTGDTGGDIKTMMGVFNYAMSAHCNVSCDLEVTTPEKMHYGFFLPYVQFLCWSQWQYPWFLSEDKENMIRSYSKLRSSLFPYIYAMAYKAYKTGLPILRPLPMVYEETERFDDVKNMYMFGDDLLVGVFDMNFDLPDGVWVDYFTGKEYEGNIEYEIPEGWGGALFVRKGSVFFTMKPQKYLLEKEHDYELCVYPGKDCSGMLVEDDGWTFDYEEGKVAVTTAAVRNSSSAGFELILEQRKGDYEGRENNGHNKLENSIPKISSLRPVRDIEVKIFGIKPNSITVNGENQNFSYKENYATFVIRADVHKNKDLNYKVNYQ